jgi:hydrocephalus-inducing protein
VALGWQTLHVHFDPTYRGNKISETLTQMITVAYNMGPNAVPKNERAPQGVHPKKATLELVGDINFPNIRFDKSEIKFGAVLNDTSRRIKVRCTNDSKIDATFWWSFVVPDAADKGLGKRPTSSSTTTGTAARLDPPHPINAVFDILPIRSFLKPGQSEDVEFVFYGHANHKYKATAVCEVQGGPEYEMKLDGEASSIQYKFDKTSIDFGNAFYDKFQIEELTLVNTGKVKFDFTINSDSVAPPTIIKAAFDKPGKTQVVEPGAKFKIPIQIYPGLPTLITTSFTVEVAHFEPQIIVVTGKGMFPHVAVNLPRVDPANYARLMQEAEGVLGFTDMDGAETSRTEGMPAQSQRTQQTEATEALRSGGGLGASGEMPPPTAGTRRTVATAGGVRAPPMTMETFLATNPLIRQLQAEADCLAMREFIVGQVAEKEAEEEARRKRVLFDEKEERLSLTIDLDEPDELLDAKSRPATSLSGPAAPPGPGAPEEAMTAQDALAVSVFKTGLPFIDMGPFVLSEYVCDFGHVIKGQQLQKQFRVTNVGFTSISFEYPKNVKSALTQAGFVVEPDRVNRLPGAPDYECVEFNVVFNSSRPGVNLGPIDVLIPVAVKGGPQVNVYLKANVTIPDIEVSSDNLKFGSVFCGHSRHVTVQLCNNKEIPATWSFLGALASEGKGAAKPCEDFTVIPGSGTLNPGEMCNVQVVFRPSTARAYNAKIPIRINQNPTRRNLKISAQGENLGIRFDPPMMDLDPILPFVVETERKVTIYNEMDADFEFYSLDFDEQYKEEERILQRVPIYKATMLGYEDVALLPLRWKPLADPNVLEPLRDPQRKLQAQVLEAWAPIFAAEEVERKAAEEARIKAEEEAEAARLRAEEGGGAEAPPAAEEAPAEEGEMHGEGEAQVSRPPTTDADLGGTLQPLEPDVPTVMPINMLVYGHPLASPQRIAKGLAYKYKTAVLDLEGMMVQFFKEAGISPFMEEVPDEEADDTPPKLVPVEGKWQLNETAAPVGAVKALQEIFFPPLPPPEEPEGGAQPPAEDGEDGEPTPDPGPPPPRVEEKGDGWLTTEFLAQLIKHKLASELQYARGVVVSGLKLKDMPELLDVAKAVEMALSGKTLQVIFPEYQEPPAPAEGEGEAAPAEEKPPASDDEEEKAQIGGEGEDEALNDEEEPTPFDEEPVPFEGEPAPFDPYGPEEEFDTEQLSGILEAFDGSFQTIVEYFDPPPKEEGEEAAAPPAEEEGEKVEKPPPTTFKCSRARRVGKQPLDEVVVVLMQGLPEPGPVPGEARPLKIPPVFDREIVVRPKERLDRRPVTNFYILTPELVPEEEGEPPAEGEEAEPKQPQYTYEAKTRWVVKAKSSIELLIRFKASDTGRFEAMLGFEVAGGGVAMRGREFMLPCRGTCAYPQISQNPQSIYYRKIKTKTENQIVSKQYIISKNIYEFGPLLVGRSKEDHKQKYLESKDQFRITNSGLFDMHVDFNFLKDQDGAVFVVEPESLDLAVDETADVTVFAFPEQEGEFTDKLICNIKNNPEPVEISLMCTGNVPKIITDIEPRLDEEGNPIEGPLTVEFQRLLLKRKDTRVVVIKNTSLLPAKWNLLGCGVEEGFNCGKEFEISPTQGMLMPGQREEITIGFQAMEKDTFTKELTLQWIDVDDLLPEKISLPIVVTAEAYEIDFTFTFPEGEGIDFGTLKVEEGGEQSFTIANNGKYTVGYKFAFARAKRSAVAKYFTIENEPNPEDPDYREDDPHGKSHGALEPGSEATIKIVFASKDFPSEEEVNIQNNTELRCYVSELLTGEEIFGNPIKLNVRSVFSKFRILPQKGISFGALTYNTQKTRTFDIINQGDFEFEFKIECITGKRGLRPGTANVKAITDPEFKGEDTGDGGLKVGSFVVRPASGTVAPSGEKETITVEFSAEGEASFYEVLGVQISQRDPRSDVPDQGTPYEISGESCIPGILTQDFLQIFEEAAVSRKAPSDPEEIIKNTFIEEDRTLYFGPRLVSSRSEMRIKITNPTKVPILVNVDMVAKGAEPMAFEVLEPKQLQIPMHEHRYATILFEPTGLQTFICNFEATVEEGTDPKTNSLVFEVRGEGTLPRVSVLQPTVRNVQGQALMVFNKLLKGKTQTQTMLIKNEGILPANVRFGRLAPWPRDPDAPADEAEPVNPQESFSFTGRGQELLLQAKEERKFDVTFMPKQVGKLRAAINMVVANNEFESSTIEVAGEGFEQDVSLGNLPENSEDTLKFGNLTVGVAKQLSFTISNNSTKVWRFQWAKEDEDNYITFSPQEGHLQPGQTKDVMATILAKKELDLDAGKPFTLETTQIIYTGDGGDWDDSIKDVEWVNDGNDTAAMDASLDQSLTESPKRGGRRKPKKVVKHRPEPAYEVVRQGDPPTAEEGEEPPEDTREPIVESVIMKVSLTADYLKYAFMSKSEDGGAEEVESLPPLVFAETMMYRERLHKFSFKNTSKSTMEYAWRICFPDDQEDLSPENPFTVEPSNGKLQPDETVQISVKFAPTEVDHFKRKILCDIPNLDTRVVKTIRPAPAEGEEEAPPPEEEDEPVPEPQPQPVLEISGKSARPLCHLELEESDWLSGGRRPPTLTAPGGKPVDPSSRCLEFESLGTQVRNTRRFFVMNPTNISYKYRWECDDGTGAAVSHLASAFKCVHKEGFVLSGKKSEMVFEYIPDSDQLLESFWRFTIPEHDISVPFILVGHVKEPRVFFDKTYCNFNSLLIDRKGVQSVKLVNREHIPFSFSFDGKTYGANADPPVVKITPEEGTVPPEGEQTITVEFTPRLEKNYNYNAVCLVKKKATRLALNIKGEGFDNHVSITMDDERGSVQVLPGGATPVDFGEVHLNELRQKTITVTNKGKYPIEYDWQTAKNRMLTIKPPRGIVQKGDKQDVKLVFHPMAEAQMLDHPVELRIINGPRYTFNLSARGRRPQLNFSFQRMDFGPCFLYRQGAAPTTAVLRLTNEDTHDISYDCEFDNKGYLEVDAPPTNLAPGQSEEIKIVFMPRELKEYSDTVPFRINGLITVNVEILGSGHECDIAVANPMNFNFSLGAVKVGSVVERRIKVKNSSAVYAECSIAAAVARLASLSISIRPTEFALRPRETIELELTYAPQDRMAPFSEDVKVHIAGVNKTLMVVNGSAVGVELKLETDMLFFGAVVANSRAKRKVLLENVGDIGTKFQWAAEAFLPDFSVEPTEGFLNPHDEVTLEFTFQPGFVNDDCRRDNVPLYIDGTDPLLMTTTGICVSQQPNEETLSFETPVRKPSVQQTPPITNKTDQPWRLIPVVDNKYWSVPDILEIPAGQSLGCALTYTPHAMTSHMDPEPEEPAEGEPPRPPPSRPRKHTGSVFIPMPDGTAVLYNLTGTAGPPEQEGETIMRQVQCKAQHTEQLPVRNWLNRPQRFTVQIEPPPEGTTSIKGATYIDVPANAERTYALRFHTFVEGSTEVKVTLTNEETGEYLYYSIQFAAAAPPVLRSFELNTVVRQGKALEIDLANPLSQEVTMKASCDNVDIVLQPEYVLRPMGETPCKLIYRPLLASQGVTATNVTFSSPELGDFVYELRTKATAAGADRSMQFKSPIGSTQTQTFRFLHFLPSDCTYECSTDNEMFTVPGTVSASAAETPDGTEVTVEVAFDPSQIGESNGKLLVTSETGGSYTCILNGHGQGPRPQGPFVVSGSYAIDFKNPFPDSKSFIVAVDNPNFKTIEQLPDVPGRSSANISVSYSGGGSGHVQAKLTVVCEGYPPWLYYLKGE